MLTHFCSLYYHYDRDADQYVDPDTWTLVRFPYGSSESTDRENMHALADALGEEHPYPADPASALIWPQHDSTELEPIIGHLWGTVMWDDANYTELRGQFSRDPLGINDVTGTVHYPRSPGMQCFTFPGPPIEINSRVPLGLEVMHNASGRLRIRHAKIKLTYYTPQLPPPEGQATLTSHASIRA